MKPAGRKKRSAESLRYEVTHGGKYATIRSGRGKNRVYHGIVKFDALPEWRKKQYYANKRQK